MALRAALADTAGQAPAAVLHHLVAARFDRLPLPGGGATLARWRVLAAVGAHDLSVAKLFEGHTDALAILAEAGHAADADADAAIWATWCAEPPDARLQLDAGAAGHTLSGRKAWCSGARAATHAVVSCWNAAGEAMLAAVDLRAPGVTVTDAGWHAVGMAGSGSVDVLFDRVPATPLGAPGFYVARAGFWHGGAGVAACWFGAATALADALAAAVRARMRAQDDPHRLAQLGAVSVALQGSAALMRATAQAIDAVPAAVSDAVPAAVSAAVPAAAHGEDSMAAALALRLHVEGSAALTLDLVGRALGAGPLCKDPAMARRFADLPVFIRQSHAERDQAAVGRLVAAAQAERAPWML